MLIGVISDTHITNKEGGIPHKILEVFRRADMIIHAGDLIDLCVIRQLESACPRVYAVYGNMDPFSVRKELPEKQIVNAGKYKIGVTHGYGAPGSLIELMKKTFRDDKVDIIIYGHSHNPLSEIKDGILFFNPGSATDRIFAPYNSYGLIKINDKIEPQIIKL